MKHAYFLDKFLHALYYVLVIFDPFNCFFSQQSHFRTRNGRLCFINPRQLKKIFGKYFVTDSEYKLVLFIITIWSQI